MEFRYVVSTLKGAETLIMEADDHMVRFHTVQKEMRVPIDSAGTHTLDYGVGILEERRPGEDTVYSLDRVMFERNGTKVEQHRVEKDSKVFS